MRFQSPGAYQTHIREGINGFIHEDTGMIKDLPELVRCRGALARRS
jgi:hypothetical protein